MIYIAQIIIILCVFHMERKYHRGASALRTGRREKGTAGGLSRTPDCDISSLMPVGWSVQREGQHPSVYSHFPGFCV